MKKFVYVLFIVLVSCSALMIYRYLRNPPGLVPLPYELSSQEIIESQAPIIMIGDRMAEHFSLFHVSLSAEMSENLTEPIKIHSLGKKGFGIHRTLHQLKHLKSQPALIIYHGGSEEYLESIYDPTQIKHIENNFQIFNDPYWLTFMTIYPWSARFIYTPFKKLHLSEAASKPLNTDLLLKDQSFIFKLYEEHLKLLVKKAKELKSSLILVTSPINLLLPPKKVCSSSQSNEITVALKDIRQHYLQQDYKNAYSLAEKLSQVALANAEVYFLLGQSARKLGDKPSALKALHLAAVFDCQFWRGHEIFNQIIRKVAAETKTSLFDFASYVDDQIWEHEDSIFFDEIYPQNHFYEQASKLLALQAKKLLDLP